MKKFLKTLLLAVMAAMLLSFACIGAAADGADAEYPAAVPITYDGMSARVKTDAPGLRSMYHVDLAAVKAWEDAGYTVEYGAIMAGEKNKLADKVSSTPDQLRVVKNAETGEYTAYVVDGVQKAQPVCVYSSAETSYASGIFTYKNETEAGFAFTGVFRYEQQNSVYYSFGFIYAGFFYAEKEGEEPIVEYIVPEVADGEFFADNKCTLLEVSTYWAEQPGAYATNKNILNVIRSQQETVYTETYSAEEPLSLAANATHEMTLSNMKEGIYAVKVKATGSTDKYGLVYYANGGVGRQYMKKMKDGTSAWQYIYLNEGDNTVSIKPAGAITVENIEVSLVEEITPEKLTASFSFAASKDDGTFEDRVVAGDNYVANPESTNAYFYDGDSGRSVTVKFDGVKAGKYRVYAIGHTGSASTQIAVTVSEIESPPKTYNRTGDGSSGAGGNYIDFGAYDFSEGTNNVTIAATGSYVNIGTILLVREAHTVTIQNFDGKILSKQEVYTGEYAASTNVTSVPSGYELVDKVAFSSLPITEDTVIYPNARRTDALSATIDGTTLTVEGATEGYYDLDINVTADFSSDNYLWVEVNGNVYGDRCLTYKEGHTETISMAVYLKGGTNTLTVKSHDGKKIKNIVVNSATFTNVQHTYNAVRVLGKDFTEDSVFQNTSEKGIVQHKLALRAGDMAIYSSVTFLDSGYYFFYSAGRAEKGTVKLTVGETEKVLSVGATVGNATHHTKFHSVSNNLIYVEAGTYDVTLSEHAKVLLSMDALVFAPHLDCTPEDEYTVDVAPTCMKDGSKSKHCTVCGEIIKKTVTSIPADNDLHIGDWELIEGTEHGAAKVNCTVCEKTVVKEFVDPYSQKAKVTVREITGSGTAEATFTVTTDVTGWYEVEILGHVNTGKYFKLYNESVSDKIYTYQKDTNAATAGFGVYLVAGVDNHIVYKKETADKVTLTGVNVNLLSAHAYEDYATVLNYFANYESAGNRDIGTVTVDKDGYYYLGMTMSPIASGNVTITLTAENDSPEIPEIKENPYGKLLLSVNGSTSSLGYHEFNKIVYLVKGDYTVNVANEARTHIGTFFVYPVDTTDHVCTKFDEVETLAPTCNEEGVMTEVCVLCGEVNSERPIPATGEHIGEWSVTTEPTCDTEGVNSCICTVCGEVTSTEAIAAKGHTGEWVVTKEMTATEDGLMKQLCGECGKTTVKTMKNPYIIQTDNDNVTVGEITISDDSKTATFNVNTDVAGWYEVKITLANAATGAYFKMYNATLSDDVYTYQKDTNAATAGFGVYLVAGQDNKIVYTVATASTVDVTAVDVALVSAHAYEDYATSNHTSLVQGKTATYEITVSKDGYYILGGTSKLQDTTGILQLDIVGNDINTPPLTHDFANALIIANGSSGTLGYDEFGMVYLTAGTYTVTASNPKSTESDPTNVKRVYIGSLFAYAVEMGEHIHSAETTSEITTPPTCNEAGERTYYCLDCGEAVSTEVVDATGKHSGEWTIVMPTVDAEGSATMTCSCGETLNKVLARLTDVSGATPITATAEGESKAYTFTVTVEKTGFYKVIVDDVGTDASSYWYLSANGYSSSSKEVKNAFAAYLVAGENTVTYNGPAAASATFTLVEAGDGAVGASGTLVLGKNNAATGKTGDLSKITVTQSGFYLLASYYRSTENTSVSVTLTDENGISTALSLAFKNSDYEITAEGSGSTCFDTFQVVYLEAGEYAITVSVPDTVNRANVNALFAIPVVATDATSAE